MTVGLLKKLLSFMSDDEEIQLSISEQEKLEPYYIEESTGEITWKEVDKLLGYNSNNNSTVLSTMKTHNVPRIWVKCHHSQFYYERKAVEALRGVIKPCKKRQRKNGLD